MIKIKKRYVIVLILVILICILNIYKRTDQFKNLYDDILFLKTTKQKEEKIEHMTNKENNKEEITPKESKKYIFNITCNDTNFKNVNLLETINEKTLVNEKIAPGVSGIFDIILNTNQNTYYKLEFQSKNNKPQNLKFKDITSKKESSTLEGLEAALTGNLRKNTTKTITIYWYWEYESTQEADIQDTKDSQDIQNYEFTIYAIGEQMI